MATCTGSDASASAGGGAGAGGGGGAVGVVVGAAVVVVVGVAVVDVVGAALVSGEAEPPAALSPPLLPLPAQPTTTAAVGVPLLTGHLE
jgi:hypothetical protein